MAEFKVAGVCYNKYEAALAVKLSKVIDAWGTEKHVKAAWYIADDDNPNRALFQRVQGPVRQWTVERFADADVIIYIAPVVRVVRYIGALLEDQLRDPAVLAVDASGKYCVPVLSGRRGEAYELAGLFEDKLGIDFINPVIPEDPTHFDIAMFAKKNDMVLSNSDYAKEITAAISAGGEVGFYTDYPVIGKIPGGMHWSTKGDLGVYLSPSYQNAYFAHTLWMIPKCITIGLAFQDMPDYRVLLKLINDMLREKDLYPEAVARVAVAGDMPLTPETLKFCFENDVSVVRYSREQLAGIENPDGSPMDDSERAALKSSEGKLISRAVTADNMSCAIATKNMYINFF